jgi:hypothetical protein
MPFSFHFDDETKMFHVRAIGAVNDVQLLDLSNRLHCEPAYGECHPILCDFTAVTEVSISSSLIESLAKAARPRTNFVAVIAPGPVAFGLARMYQIITDPEDARINVFAEPQEALMWLGTQCLARQNTLVAKPGEPETAVNTSQKGA